MSLPNFDLNRSRDVNSDVAGGSGIESQGSGSGLAARPRRERIQPRPSSQSAWRLQLGVDPRTTSASVALLLVHATCSVLFLVFLNSAQAFLLPLLAAASEHERQDAPDSSVRLGSLSGRLQLSDELLSVVLVLFWGALADRSGGLRGLGGVPMVAAFGYALVAAGLGAYALAQKPWPDLLWARLVFASGASAVTAMLTGALATYAAPPTEEQGEEGSEVVATTTGEEDVDAAPPGERTPLLQSSSTTAPASPFVNRKRRHGRLSAFAGLLTGIGAVIAVLFLLPLPIRLAAWQGNDQGPHKEELLLRATRQAFLLVAALALLVSLAIALGLREPVDAKDRAKRREQVSRRVGQREQQAQPAQQDARAARRARLQSRRSETSTSFTSRASVAIRSSESHLLSLLRGFSLALHSPTLLLSYLGGSLARSLTLSSTLFLPLYIAHHFYVSRPDLCHPPPEDGGPPLKETCRQAYILASAQSGVLQTMCLIAAPIAGWACDSLASPEVVLLTASLAAALGFGGYAGVSDPQRGTAWATAALVGTAQGLAIVSSLALVARGRWEVEAHGREKYADVVDDGEEPQGEVAEDRPGVPTSPRGSAQSTSATRSAGAISGAYSSCGALAIILVSSIGGTLFDYRPVAPFWLLAGLAGATALATGLGIVVGRRRGN